MSLFLLYQISLKNHFKVVKVENFFMSVLLSSFLVTKTYLLQVILIPTYYMKEHFLVLTEFLPILKEQCMSGSSGELSEELVT